MKIITLIKKAIKRIIGNKSINILLRIILKPVLSIIPKWIRCRIPIIGINSFKLPNGEKFYIYSDKNTDGILSLIYWDGLFAYESSTTQLFISLLKYTNTVFDIGAYTGFYSIIAAIDNPNRNVYAFEPVPMTFFSLSRNVEINGLKNLQINSSAISNYDGVIKLYIPQENLPTDASTLEGFRYCSKEIMVQAITIDTFVKQNNILKIDLLKIDTEATEHLVLEGARNIIKRDEPIIISEVLSGRTEQELHSVLDDLGYKYYLISDKGLIKKETIEGDKTYKNKDYLFITEKRFQKTKELKDQVL